MAYEISDFNGTVIAPDADYPWGNIKDAPSGTVVDTVMMTDLIQFFQKLMAAASVTPNGLPDNEANGNQFYEAFNTLVRNVTIPALIAPDYTGTGYSSGATNPIKYGLMGNGMVQFKGLLYNSSPTGGISTNTKVFSIGSGAYPPTDQYFLLADINTPSPVYVKVESGGDVYVMGALTPFDSNGVYFNFSYTIQS